VKVELWPKGSEKRARLLGVARITNDGSNGADASVGDYQVDFSLLGKPEVPWMNSKVFNFPRKRLGAWDLLFWALSAVVGNRNPSVATPSDEAPPPAT